jgi:fluoroacetyl-CoA thioesterase
MVQAPEAGHEPTGFPRDDRRSGSEAASSPRRSWSQGRGGDSNVRETLRPGIEFEYSFRIPDSKTLPALYPESDEFRAMPEVFATGFLVGFLEWACIKAVNPHLDWPREQTVGTHVDVSHVAATPAGFVVTAKVRLVQVDGRRLTFEVEVHDGVELISRGIHQRCVISRDRFDSRMREKTGGKPA